MIRVCYPFVGDSVGGSHKSALALIQNLDWEFVEPLILVHREGPLCELLEKYQLSYSVLPLSGMAGDVASLARISEAGLRALPTIRTFIREHGVDLVHSNDLRCNLTWSLPSRIWAKHIWHQRTLLSRSPLWKAIGMLTNHVICISHSVRSTYRATAPVSIVINPFHDARLDRPTARAALAKELGISNSRAIVGYVGRLASQKGFEDFCRLAFMLPEVTMVAAGDGPLSALLPNAVRNLGFRDPIEPVLAALDVLVAPSRQEGYGRVLAEAMLAGTPIVATDIPAHREVSAGNAVLVPAGDQQKMADAVIQLLNEEDFRRSLAKSASISASARFGISDHVESIQSIYRTILSQA